MTRHQFYRYRKESWLERFRRWFPIGFRWVVRNPEHTKKHPAKGRDLFALK